MSNIVSKEKTEMLKALVQVESACLADIWKGKRLCPEHILSVVESIIKKAKKV